MVERTAVNRDVVGSSPTRGAQLIIRLRGQAVKTSPFHGGNTGSIPVGVIQEYKEIKYWQICILGIYLGSNINSIKYVVDRIRADVAQLAEQLICNQQVIGSSPIIGFKHLDH